ASCRELGADAILTKPASMGRLRETLGRWLNLERPQAAEEREDPAADADARQADLEIVRIFLRESARRMTAIRQADATPAGRQIIANEAHTLQGTSRYVGGFDVARTARHLETVAAAASEAELRAAVETLNADYRRLRRQLREAVSAAA
ncbi:MAG TPA: Hpt domain-containing protein, partial [Gammaproteobacteria bacterium]|nr:Hpt domain-containing protein [Gammaproteobacteria bacterium]